MTNDDIIPKFNDDNDESLKINLQKVNIEGGLVVGLSGKIDTYNSTFFQKQVQQVIETGFTRLLFNCSDLNYVSSTGIGSFVAFIKAVKPHGGDVVLLEVQPKVYEDFQLLGVSQIFNIKDTLESAIGYFRGDVNEQDPEVFPKVFPCPTCSKKQKAIKPGRFRCPECKSILAIDNAGMVFLG